MTNEEKALLEKIWLIVFEKQSALVDSTNPVDCGKFMAYTTVANELIKIKSEDNR